MVPLPGTLFTVYLLYLTQMISQLPGNARGPQCRDRSDASLQPETVWYPCLSSI
jgi:hypothetical protein